MYGGHFHIRWNNALTPPPPKKKSLCVSGNDNDDDGDDDIGDECLDISA
jgi:hypothetical protein